jgi:hypothetical protein
MPRQKDLKRLVRARMQKTGEAYTAARAQVLRKPRTPKGTNVDATPAAAPAAPSTAAQPDPKDFAAIAGMSDAIIKEKTGCTWELWVQALDYSRAYELSHREIAKLVKEKWDTPSWWTQMVTVGYERIKGLRAMGQRRSGDYEAGKSKTFAAPVGRVYRAFRDARTRQRWLGDVNLTVRTAVPNKSMRITWPDGTSVEWYFVPKGARKCQVAVQHGKLADREAVDRLKAYWGERLGVLETMLASRDRKG